MVNIMKKAQTIPPVLTITLVLRWADARGVIHAFRRSLADGNTPAAPLVIDPAGHLFGTTSYYFA